MSFTVLRRSSPSSVSQRAARCLGLAAIIGCARAPQPIAQPDVVSDALATAVAHALPFNARDDSSLGLLSLARQIGDARIVMLGEPWHGDGGAIRMRSDVVRYLHEHLGFDVIAFEADFYSLTQGWKEIRQDSDVRRYAAENVYQFWSTANAAQPLWAYIESQRSTAHALQVVGLDPKHTGAVGRRRLGTELDRSMAAEPLLTDADRVTFRAVLQGLLLREQVYRPTPADVRVYFTVLDRILASMPARPAVERDPFWEQEVRNLRAAGDYHWKGASRDRAMGDNLAWIATRLYPGQKIIVWAHNNHIMEDKWVYYTSPDTLIQRQLKRQSESAIGRSTYLGAEARQLFGPRVYALGFLSGEGTFTPGIGTNVDPATGELEKGDFQTTSRLSPAPAPTLEHALTRAGFQSAFIDLRGLRGSNDAIAARALDYSITPPLLMRYWDAYDGFLFLRKTIGLTESPTATPP